MSIMARQTITARSESFVSMTFQRTRPRIRFDRSYWVVRFLFL